MSDKFGKLYVCSTPIGNLEDITFRAVRILKEVDFIIAEDTRITQKLLNRYEIKSQLVSYHKYSEKGKAEQIIEALINGKNVALVSDSGTPVISDPGNEIIIQARKTKIDIIPIPGPSALTCAVSASELVTDGFVFYGFLSKNKAEKQKVIKNLSRIELPVVIFESPQRVISTMEDIQKTLGDIKLTVARELTKIHEEIITDSVENLIEYFNNKSPKGEFTLIIDKVCEDKEVLSTRELQQLIVNKLNAKQTIPSIAKELAESLDCNKNYIYRLALQLAEENQDESED